VQADLPHGGCCSHPGVQKVMNQPEVNLAGPVKVLSEAHFPTQFKGIYMTPVQTRKMFEEKGWSKIAAFPDAEPNAPLARGILQRSLSRPWTAS